MLPRQITGISDGTRTGRAELRLMLVDIESLVRDFGHAAAAAGLEGWPCPVRTETVLAPHTPPRLPSGQTAVYVFALGAAFGASAPAGAGAVLKVGRVGPASGPALRISTTGCPHPPRSRGASDSSNPKRRAAADAPQLEPRHAADVSR